MAERKSDNARLADKRISSPYSPSKPSHITVEEDFQTVSWWLNTRRRCHKHTIVKRNAVRRKIRH
ncbi:hypothetical protein [Thalassotalea mangrovi]|uniref:Uncharacterized protein n=1 Tax=Thalassotalea mangrovi TaxID=2572245 RepID=A0A4U1B1D5_9GAMM|nr:hypothetical protein [Thalassotalea mangrovi]TKB43137.1 hypothetical protein E8M12_15770 [Thalassotalea mangrovi]